jgi:RimJ/RimL family protein N-acetyltransferase
MGVLKAHSGKGIGYNLMTSSIDWAQKREMYRLGFDVRCDNYRAVALYTRIGFEIEGKIRRAAFIDGNYIDKYLMSILL